MVDISRTASSLDAVLSTVRSRIARGEYRVGERLPTIRELSVEFYGSADLPRYAREVYAALIAEGMVEARVGRTGGHYVVSATPSQIHEYLTGLAADLAALLRQAERLAHREIFIVDIRNSLSQNSFGESLQLSRQAAERFAASLLIELGESKAVVAQAVARASRTTSSTPAGAHQLRIYSRRIAGQLHNLGVGEPPKLAIGRLAPAANALV